MGYPPENRFLKNCCYVFEDIDFWVFATFLTLAQITFMFSEPFDLTRSSKGGKSGVTPLKICLWRIAAMFLKISTSGFLQCSLLWLN
jgi:hypothetical protein